MFYLFLFQNANMKLTNHNFFIKHAKNNELDSHESHVSLSAYLSETQYQRRRWLENSNLKYIIADFHLIYFFWKFQFSLTLTKIKIHHVQ